MTVDHKKMGKGLIAHTLIGLRQHTRECLSAFQSAVAKLHGIIECGHLAGSYDFILKIVIRDIAEYQDLLMNQLSKLPDVSKMQSLFIMSEVSKS